MAIFVCVFLSLSPLYVGILRDNKKYTTARVICQLT